MNVLNPYLNEIIESIGLVLKINDLYQIIRNKCSRIQYLKNADASHIDEISETAKICLKGNCSFNNENIVFLCENIENFIKISDLSLNFEKRKTILLADDEIFIHFMVPALTKALYLIRRRITEIHEVIMLLLAR